MTSNPYTYIKINIDGREPNRSQASKKKKKIDEEEE